MEDNSSFAFHVEGTLGGAVCLEDNVLVTYLEVIFVRQACSS